MKKSVFFAVAAMALVVCTSVATSAQELSPNEDYFKNWTTVSTYMRSQGIDPVQVNWLIIEPLCLGLKKAHDDQVTHRDAKTGGQPE